MLVAANELYDKKEFEYLEAWHVGRGFKNYPDIEKLAALARKIAGYRRRVRKRKRTAVTAF